MKSNKKGLWIILAVFAALLIGIVVYMAINGNGRVEKKNYSDLQEYIRQGKVVEIVVENDKATFELESGSTYYTYIPDRTSLDEFIQTAQASGVDVSYNDRYVTSVWDYITPLFSVLAIIVLGIILFRSISNNNKQVADFSKSGAEEKKVKVRFNDVAGAEEEKEELKEIVEFLREPKKFTDVGAKIPRGVLLVGPPGTGKTLFAKAVAGEANVPFFSISGSDFVEMYVGVGASRVRDLFATAKRNKPCIIFIDEIDAVGRQRGAGLGGGHDEREQTLNQLLVQMDGFETSDEIIVMAATNRADILDPALLRPGRFDRQIMVNLPDVRGREEIFKVHARNKPLADDVDFKILARATSGFSGAEIANLLNESAILCARAGRTRITMKDVYEGIDKVVMGPQKKSRLVTEVDKRITAYHEAGHALVAMCLPACDPVHEITIVPRGGAGGYTMLRPDNDNVYVPLSKLKSDLAMTMGGRAAEEIIIKDYTTGASADIRQVTSTARRMVTELGMSDLGPVYYGSDREVFLGRDYTASHSYSEAVAAKIDAEVNRLIREAHDKAAELIRANLDKLETMVRVLIECETIYAEEVKMIMDGATVSEVKEALQLRYEGKKDSQAKSAVSGEVAQNTQNEQTDSQNPNQTTKENSDDIPQNADDKSLGE
ncbi:MAG: ATP-dependent zinc metalloprotease FtsH [Clostridia bacterium]|nr:ATP-dependent zinc metalloprotease FtsH [Clostridia bacterium]